MVQPVYALTAMSFFLSCVNSLSYRSTLIARGVFLTDHEILKISKVEPQRGFLGFFTTDPSTSDTSSTAVLHILSPF